MRRLPMAAVSWIVATFTVFSASVARAQQPVAQPVRVAAAGAMLDLGYVTPEAAFAAAVHPKRVLTAPGLEMLPVEVLSAWGKRDLGIDPLQVESVLAIVEAPRLPMPPQIGFVARLTAPIDLKGALAPLVKSTVEGDLAGRAYRRAQEPMAFSVFQPDDRTVLVANDELLRRMVANHASPKAGPVSRLLADVQGSPDGVAVLAVEPVRGLLTAQLGQDPPPPPFAGVMKIPGLLSSVEASANLTGQMAMSLTLRANDEAAAKELEEIIGRLIEVAKQGIAADMARQAASDDPVERAGAQYTRRITESLLDALRPKRDKDRLVLASEGRDKAQVATIGLLTALLLPAVQSSREAARRTMSTNNLRQIGLAMLAFETRNRAFPARASFDKQGKPLLSWRVHLLPYVDGEGLYRQFHLDEPWDSENNRKLIPLMPTIYQNPSAQGETGKAHYLAVTGPGTMFEGTKGRSLADIKRGTSETIIVVEVNPDRAVTWTKPDDWEFNPKEPLAGLGSAHTGGFLALFADGSVRLISKSIDQEVIGRLMRIADRENP